MSVAFQQSENPKMAPVLLLANHVSVGPSLVGAVSDRRPNERSFRTRPEVDSPADVYFVVLWAWKRE